MPGFDAVCNSLSTISTGGFSTGDRNGLTDGIMMVFMFLGGTSFILLYNILKKKNPLRSEEFRVYLGIIIIMSFLISPYQVVSVITSTGSVPIAGLDFGTKMLLFVLMFIGACSTSTGGGIKITRWLIVFKTMNVELKRILHPHAVFNIKIDNKTLPQEVIGQTIMFVCFYFAILGVSAVLIGLLEQNAAAAIMGSVSTLGNIGLVENCARFQPLTKVIMIINMLVGRLELIPFLVLFNRD
jgi:trk system potassium uptake protein TrkH